MIAAERAFSAEAGERGWVPAFRAWLADDAVQFAPELTSAKENMAHTEDDHFTGLDWRPAFAGLAQSGEIGFTTGPWFVRGQSGARGHYFTIWRMQTDGSWKWVFDGGVPAVADVAPIATDAPVAEMHAPAPGNGSFAGVAVSAVETQIATGNALARDALTTRLADDAHVLRTGAAPVVGRADAAALIAHDPSIQYTVLQTMASKDGNLGFALGDARWNENGAEKRGHYARVWRRDAESWRIVFDELIPPD
ncbi:MAG: hypothetical protein ABUS57_04355 [Pseudomonadota bacterium]